MAEQILDTPDIDIQRQINRAVLFLVGRLDERGLSFGRNRIGSVLKGHRHKYILENKLDLIEIYGLLQDIDFKLLMNNIDKLVEHGYLTEKKPDLSNAKFSDAAGNALYLTEKGQAKLEVIMNTQAETQKYTTNASEKQKPNYSIADVVNLLRNKSEKYPEVFKTERRYEIMQLYFGRLMTMEEVGQHLGVTRERVRQLIQREIKKLNRFSKVRAELMAINAVLEENPSVEIMAVLKSIYGQDHPDTLEMDIFQKLLNYMLKTKGFYTFQE